MHRLKSMTAIAVISLIVIMLNVPVLFAELKRAGVNVADYGTLANGSIDVTDIVQKALDDASTQGTVCYLPPGKYRIDGHLTVPSGVTFMGASEGIPHSEHTVGTIILAYGGKGNPDGDPLITLKPNAAIQGMIIHYPLQKLPEAEPYAWTIRADGELCQITDMVMTNPYQALDLGSKWNELHTVRNVFACPLSVGIYIDQCTDVGRIENVHFNPNFWTRMAKDLSLPGKIPDTEMVKKYQENNLIGFKIGKTDWEFITNCFVIFPRIGFHFDDFGHGPGNAVITQSGSDICSVAVRIDRTQDHAGVQIANGQFMATIEIGAENRGPVKLTNCGFWGIPGTREHVIKHGPSTLMMTSCHFTGWDAVKTGEPCVRADGGRLMLNGCEFMDEGKKQISFDKGLIAATVTGCLLRGDNGIENRSDAQVEMGYNTTE